MTNIKLYIITKYSLYKIIQKIKKSDLDAYNIGYELSYLAHIMYNIFHDPHINILDNALIYNLISNVYDYNNLYISKYLSKNILYNDFFKLLSYKLEKIKHIYSFMRGYYINEYNLYSTNINSCYLDFNYLVLYDFHPYFLYIIYKKLNKLILKNKIKFLLNYDKDEYSINEYSDKCDYKLVFIHKSKYYNNSIKNILKLLYTNCELFSQEDEYLYQIYVGYMNTDINY